MQQSHVCHLIVLEPWALAGIASLRDVLAADLDEKTEAITLLNAIMQSVRASGPKEALHEDVFETSTGIEHTVNLDSSFADDPVDDSPRVLLNLEPRLIADGAQLPRRAAAIRKDLERFAAGDNAEEDLVGAERGLVREIGSQALNVAGRNLRTDDGVASIAHLLAALESAALARRRTSAVE